MITVIVGHRGVGKSELIKRLQLYLVDTGAEFIDLDFEIERKINRPLVEFFLEKGEAYFRELEKQLFLEIVQREHKHTYICLGAGFDLNVLPDNIEVLWVRRRTDQDGRIFLNRPRLNPDISPLEEFKKRALLREEMYRLKATRTYNMPEGLFDLKIKACAIEKEILAGIEQTADENHPVNDRIARHIGGVLTILPEHFKNEITWQSFKTRFFGKSILFELRNDFLNDEQISRVITEAPAETFLYAFRRDVDLAAVEHSRFRYLDWPLEMAGVESFVAAIPFEKRILSFHAVHASESLESILFQLEKYQDRFAHIKVSPLIDSFAELVRIYKWQQALPLQRNFLPRSLHGHWTWFRLFMKARQKLNFWREGDGSALDQPSLFEWLATPVRFQNFAAVLGDPVHHSWTPLEQMDFFAKKQAPVFAIRMARDEWDQVLPFLLELGLKWAAVTSPHKNKAAEMIGANGIEACNTLYWNGQKWLGTSTDEAGFLELIEGIGAIAPLQKDIFIWGGGGTLKMLKHALPRATYFSSRTGQLRPEHLAASLPSRGHSGADSLTNDAGPQILIWAAPRSPETQMPPAHWKPTMVIDMNYKEDSLGREYAQMCGANYQSGLKMFLTQAQGQRVFWNKVTGPIDKSGE